MSKLRKSLPCHVRAHDGHFGSNPHLVVAQTGQEEIRCPVTRAVSMGRRNTISKSACKGFNS
jgi:hypothetical protein